MIKLIKGVIYLCFELDLDQINFSFAPASQHDSGASGDPRPKNIENISN